VVIKLLKLLKLLEVIKRPYEQSRIRQQVFFCYFGSKNSRFCVQGSIGDEIIALY
jgi:hypothetical protein